MNRKPSERMALQHKNQAIQDKEIEMLNLYTDLEVRVREAFERVSRRDEGAGIVEYLLLVVFIALALILALAFFTGRLGNAFSRAGNSLN